MDISFEVDTLSSRIFTPGVEKNGCPPNIAGYRGKERAGTHFVCIGSPRNKN